MTTKTKSKQSKRIRTGDKVIVVSGANRGSTGVVLSRNNDRCIVQGVNMRKKATRPSQVNPQGGLIDIEVPIHASNLAIVTDDGNAVKLKCKTGANGERELYYKQGGQEVAYRPVKKAK